MAKAPKQIVNELTEVLEMIDERIELRAPHSDELWLRTWVRPSIRRSLAWAQGDPEWHRAGDVIA